MTTNDEEWRALDWLDPDYEVSDQGRVRSWKNNRWGRAAEPALLALIPGSNGYPTVSIRQRHHAVHLLVLRAFRGAPPPGNQGRHKDGDPSNPRLDNLHYGTRSQNQEDRVGHGTSNRGERHGLGFLTELRVRAIRRLLEGGMKPLAVAQWAGVSVWTVYDIRRGRRWGWLT